MRRVLVACALAAIGCGKADGSGPAPEVAESQVKLDLPAVPNFEEPTTYPDGTHSVLEMRRRGKKFLEQNVKVKAYVVWIYDCATTLGPQVVKDTPEKCDRPHFRLGDSADAREDQTIEVVDVPRAPRDDAKKFLPPEEAAAMDAAYKAIPPFQVGSQAVVEGKWATRSPKGFVNSDGLLVFAGMAVEGVPQPPPAPAPGAPPGGAAPAPGAPPAGATKAPPPGATKAPPKM